MGGYQTDSILTRMGHESKRFQGKRLMGYPEKVMIKTDCIRLAFGSGSRLSPVFWNLDNTFIQNY
jgi:hypothetical protein